MTVYKHPRGHTWRFDFKWRPPGSSVSRRYAGTTGQLTKDAAERVEQQVKQRVREDAYGIAPFDRLSTPSFQAWAVEHVAHLERRGRASAALKQVLRLCLQFWGRRPLELPDPALARPRVRAQVAAARARMEAAPYHDLRLIDPITTPDWIERFEAWMRSRALSGSRRNHYRSAMSGLYRTAMLPAYRGKTRITANPFLGVERDRVPQRTAVLSQDELRAWMTAAPPHARLALAIAVYAPELRRGSILALRWDEHIDAALTRITVPVHKSARWSGRPQVVPIVPDLRTILVWARQAAPDSTHIVSYRGQPITRIERGLRAAAAKAGLVYGQHGGVTFHTVRHTLATWLAEWGHGDAIRQLVMGHQSAATTQRYTHLAGIIKQVPLEDVAARVQGLVQIAAPAQAENIEDSGPSLQATQKRKRRRKAPLLNDLPGEASADS